MERSADSGWGMACVSGVNGLSRTVSLERRSRVTREHGLTLSGRSSETIQNAHVVQTDDSSAPGRFSSCKGLPYNEGKPPMLSRTPVRCQKELLQKKKSIA